MYLDLFCHDWIMLIILREIIRYIFTISWVASLASRRSHDHDHVLMVQIIHNMTISFTLLADVNNITISITLFVFQIRRLAEFFHTMYSMITGMEGVSWQYQLPSLSPIYYCHWNFMMTSSNGNIFRVTGHLCGKFTGPRWISRTKASDAELWCFLWFTSE